MTDTRLPGHWLLHRDLDKLSDGAWRAFTRALMFCNQQGTDGEIDTLYLYSVYPWSDPSPLLEEIVAIGWLKKTETGYVVPDWVAKGQSTAAEVDAYHQRNRAKQKTYRERSKALKSEPVTSDVTGDISGDVGEARLKARQGEARTEELSWPVVEIPNTDQERDKEN